MTCWGNVIAGVGLFADNLRRLSHCQRNQPNINKDMATSSDLNQNEMESNMPFPFCIVFHTFNKSFFQGKQFC
jgi:hypothetical protein